MFKKMVIVVTFLSVSLSYGVTTELKRFDSWDGVVCMECCDQLNMASSDIERDLRNEQRFLSIGHAQLDEVDTLMHEVGRAYVARKQLQEECLELERNVKDFDVALYQLHEDYAGLLRTERAYREKFRDFSAQAYAVSDCYDRKNNEVVMKRVVVGRLLKTRQNELHASEINLHDLKAALQVAEHKASGWNQ